jgi:RNA polymerase sigma-70 factor (ECF subfamily)
MMDRAASSSRTGALTESELADLIAPGYRLACGMLHDPTTAEDAVQEAALKAWRKQAQLKRGADPLPWFLGIVANECRSFRRRRRAFVVELDPRAGSSSPDENSMLAGADLRRALSRLRARDRLVVVLFFYLDLPVETVARIAGLSVPAARSRLYRSIKRLRPGLEPEDALK